MALLALLNNCSLMVYIMLTRLALRYTLFRRCGFSRSYSVARSLHISSRWARKVEHIEWFGTVGALLLLVGCASPTAPAVAQASTVPMPAVPVAEVLHHNIQASTTSGSIVWVCTTQPRTYIRADGTWYATRDHYIADNACPTTPIE